jgi:carboxylesterase
VLKESAMVKALILHGFTGNLETVKILGPMCEARGIPFSMPLMRGHGTRPEDLLGVTWRDWYEDAEKALLELTADGSKAIVLGLSMGGLVTLDLAGRLADRVCGVVTIAAALELRSPLLVLLPVLRRMTVWWHGKPEAALDVPAAYDRFPLETLQSLIDYQKCIRGRLAAVRAPLLVVASWSDPTVKPLAARRIYDRVSSSDKEIGRFEKSLHDMLLGEEKEDVVRRIAGWIDARLAAWRTDAERSIGVAEPRP